MKKLLLSLLCLLLLTGTAFASAVTSMDTQCTIAENGSCTVVMTAQVTFEQSEESFLLPVPSDARRISVSGFNFRKVWQNHCLCLRISAAGSFTGTQQFVVSYELPEAVSQDGDTQILELPLLGTEWPCKINGYSLAVTFPKAFDALPEFQSGYYGSLIDNYMDIRVDGCVLTSVLSQELKDHESLTLRMQMDGDFFDLRFKAGKSATLDILAFWVLFALAVGFWFVLIRGKLFLPKAHAMPPIGGNAGAVPYELQQQKADLALMIVHWASLGYLTLARTKAGKVYIKRSIEMGNERKSYEAGIFNTLFRDSDLCTPNSVTYRDLQKTAAVNTAAYWDSKLFRSDKPFVLIERCIGVAAGLFASVLCFDCLLSATTTRWIFIVLLAIPGVAATFAVQRLPTVLFCHKPMRRALAGLLGLIFLIVFGAVSGTIGLMMMCIVLQLFVGFATLFGTRRTKAGQAQLAELLGLRRYLGFLPAQETTALLADNPLYFYRTLPYASALGVGRLFALRFGKQKLEPCAWLTFDGVTPKTALGFCAYFEQVLDALRAKDALPRFPSLRRKNGDKKPAV